MKFHNMKEINEYLKELKQKGSLTEEEKQEKKRFILRNYKSMKSFLKS